jgi:Uma2 family endonuclease
MAPVLANDPAYQRLTIAEFLDMEFGGRKVELDDGVVFMMSGGNPLHAAIAANLITALMNRLRGTGCRPYGSDMATRTGYDSIRFPDVSVYCRPHADTDHPKLRGDPKVVLEVLSPSTMAHDQKTKLEEYRALAGVDAIVFVDPDRERVRLVARTGPEGWTDDWLKPGSDLMLTALNVIIPHAEIFASD